jgi:hypothetical protein
MREYEGARSSTPMGNGYSRPSEFFPISSLEKKHGR